MWRRPTSVFNFNRKGQKVTEKQVRLNQEYLWKKSAEVTAVQSTLPVKNKIETPLPKKKTKVFGGKKDTKKVKNERRRAIFSSARHR